MFIIHKLRSLFCSHPETMRKSNIAGMLYLECLHCGFRSPGNPVGPGWHLVKGEE